MSLFKKTSGQTLLYMVFQGIGLSISFVSFPIMTRIFTLEDYGDLALVNTTLALILATAKGGMTTSFIRHYHEYKTGNEQGLLYSSALGGSALISITVISVYSMILFFLRGSISPYLMKIFLIVGLVVLSRNIEFTFIGFFRAEEKIVTLNIITLLYKVGSLLMGLSVCVLLIRGLYGYFVGVIIFEAFMTLILVLMFYRKKIVSIGGISSGTVKKLFLYGLPLTFFELSALMNDYSDRFLIKFFHGSGQLGIYSAGYNLSMYVKEFLTAPLWLAIFPIYTKLWETEGNEKTGFFLSRLLKYYLCVGILLIFGVSLMSKELIVVLATKKYAPASQIVMFIVFSVVIYGSNAILNAGLFLYKKTKKIAFYTFACAVMNFLLNLYLIPRYNILGAAYSSVVSYLLLTILIKINSDKLLKVRWPVRDTIFYLAFAVIMTLILSRIDYHNGLMNLIFKSIIGFLIYSFCIFLYDSDIRKAFFSYVQLALNRN